MADRELEAYLYDGESLHGLCSYCAREVDNYDPLHRVTSIIRGGAGIECVLRGDVNIVDAGPLLRKKPKKSRKRSRRG